ncbi:DUF2933 domain-containing protein [Pseudomonas sp.]|uniref:DUF2933 domain-containing protein n=1 Tax=Pseudomonas sp. TaxID=306 RepID=UPI002C39689D|nr:DUF2933 domain-containing protein [Pseudomonas sp.]HUE91402.1 DUF2933 domain-containing protein [Pseudomonas sp.]
MPHDSHRAHAANNPWRYWPALVVFAAVALFLLWEEHEAHLLGALPYLILLLCPLMHLFMHHGHGRDHGRDKEGPHDHH